MERQRLVARLPAIQLTSSMRVLLTPGSFAGFPRLLLSADSQSAMCFCARLFPVSSQVELLRCSAVAGVLNEWLIKKSQNVLEATGNTRVQRRVMSKSLLQANIWLYGFGVAAAIFQLLVVDGSSAAEGCP